MARGGQGILKPDLSSTGKVDLNLVLYNLMLERHDLGVLYNGVMWMRYQVTRERILSVDGFAGVGYSVRQVNNGTLETMLVVIQ